ncbi:MAG: DUF4402 domain-containing protein [Betaproteobacteria bacterium]|jgi:hypothetical protein
MKKQYVKPPARVQQFLGSGRATWRLARIGVALAVTGASTMGWAQTTTPAFSVSATATVASALSITAATALGFGSFVPDTSAATVVIAPQSTSFRSRTGNISLLDSGAGAPSTVSVSGAPNMSFSVNLPTTPVSLFGPNSSAMTMTNFTSNLGAAKGTVGGGGTASFLVGATLNVGASQVPGSYTGSFSVTVSYP